MAVERKWLAVPPRPFLIDGGQFGVVSVADTAGFKVKQHVVLTALSQPDLLCQVKRVVSNTQLIVGKLDNKIGPEQWLDISAYTVSLGASIYAEEQDKAAMPTEKDHYSAIYEADPTVADRVVMVDQYGRFYSSANRLPVDAVVSISSTPIQSDPYIANISMPLQSTEYSFTFPANTVRFMMKIRDGNAKSQFSYISGQSGTNFITLNYGAWYSEETDMSNKTIYFRANKSSQIMELIYWKQP